ncbi:MAG: T9SS type A sorting domain-containing protein, partial [Bacteroidota bacterium]|nr:T9SS type A sorting domain-containing protein [Bacteroidota bacterium]
DSRFSEEISVIIPTQTFVPAQQSSNNSMIISVFKADIDNINLEGYDEIGLFCKDGDNEICCGAASFKSTITTENPLTITAWADEETTPEKDGYTEGDSIMYKLWKKNPDKIYNTILRTFINASGSPYNLDHFSTNATTEVELNFTTPPPVIFLFNQELACANQNNEIHITTQNFTKLNNFFLEIVIDTSYLTYNHFSNVNESLSSYSLINNLDTLLITWEDNEDVSINNNDTLISLNYNFNKKGNTEIIWGENSTTSGMEYQESQFINNTITIDSIPQQAENIFGDQDVCNGTPFSLYSITESENATNYIWNLSPTEAGNIEENYNEAVLNWNNDYAGESIIYVKSQNQCGTSDSTTKTISITNSVIIAASISGNFNDKCEGEEITINALITNGGNDPLISWYINNNYQYGNNSTVLNSSDLKNNDEIYCILESSSECAINNPTSSNILLAQLNPLPERPEIVAGADTICNTTPHSTYITTGSNYSDTYNWSISPQNAGEITENGQSAYIYWDLDYLGTAYIFVNGENECGEGNYSPAYITYRDYCTDTETLSENRLSISPNPVKYYLQISISENIFDAEYEILNINGINISEKTSLPQNGKINTQKLSSGIYFLRVTLQNKSFYTRFIKL